MSECWAEGWHVSLYCWLKASMAPMILSWDVSVNSSVSQEPPGQEVALVSLRLSYCLSRFSKHLWMVPPLRAMATAKAFGGCWRRCFCSVPHREGERCRNLPDQMMWAGYSSSRHSPEPSPCSPISLPEIQKEGMASPAGSLSCLPSELSLPSLP